MNKKLGISLLVIAVISAAASTFAIIMLRRHAKVLKTFITNDHGYGSEYKEECEEEFKDW